MKIVVIVGSSEEAEMVARDIVSLCFAGNAEAVEASENGESVVMIKKKGGED